MAKTKVRLSLEKVKHVAKLARLRLAKDEEIKFQKQLSEIIDYVNQLKGVGTNKIEPTSQVTSLENTFREDIVRPSLSQKEVLINTKESHNGFFKIRAIFDE